MRIALILISLLTLPMSAVAEETAGQIVVTGVGTASVAPDKAFVYVEVSRTSRQTGVAMSEVAEVTTLILSTLSAFGIEEEDIESTSLSQGEDWERVDGVRTFKGFKADNRLTVTVRDIKKVGGIMAALSKDGATGVRGPNFTVEDKTALRDEARMAAVRDGVATARILAEAAEVTLGPPMLITDGTSVSDGSLLDLFAPQFEEPVEEPIVIEAPEGTAPAVPLIPADIETTETVKLIFRIDP